MNVIDSSLWVDYFRKATPALLKQKIDVIVTDPNACLCEPILFEVLRAAAGPERKLINAYFLTMAVLPTPSDLWSAATRLGQKCLEAGFTVHAMDLLIAETCRQHDAVLTSFDGDFLQIAKISNLRVNFLSRLPAHS